MKRISSLGRGGNSGLATTLALCLVWLAPAARAEVKLPSIFGSHMVLQRDQRDPVWGWAEPGEPVTVTIGGQTKSVKAGGDGAWRVVLDPLPVGAPLTMTVKGKNSVVTFDDVLVGEVWICSGQSNMQWAVASSKDAELEVRTAKYPNIRLITVPNFGTQEPQKDFNGKWVTCSPATVPGFSAVGYFFGRQLYETLGVPIGLINDAWGGSACEAWIKRDILASDPKYAALMAKWAADEKTQAGNAGLMAGNFRPGNIYNGVLKPTIGYGIRGAIWYQGESNAGRAYQYRDLFPLMIKSWRDEWGQGDFSFYWVQLADFLGESPEPRESAWAELREAQTMTIKRLPKTGEAVIIDAGEAKDIHPKNKQDVAKRLARWALAKDYGIPVACQSPTYKSMTKQGNKIVLKFDHVGHGLNTFDLPDPVGFTIAGPDHKFVPAKARVVGAAKDTIEVWSDQVSDPASVRYAWADNPVCNVYSSEGLPATPFRTDDWPGVTVNNLQ
jgi:sialate O-acetylesterase